jgi:HAD superfamily hydrolase (TIGR01490 family)
MTSKKDSITTYAQGVEAAFFDLDKTVIAQASMMAFRKYFREEGFLSRRIVARFIWSHLVYLHLGADDEKMERIRNNVLKLISGWDQERIREIVRDTLDDAITPIIYKEALELIKQHHDAGRLVVLISASPEEIVEPMAKHLGADVAIGSRVKVDADGRYTGEMDFFAQGPAKAHVMEEMAYINAIDLQKSYAYSDSFTDKPMLETVGHPVVVNPDRALLKLANERHWDVRKFSHPVPLTKRPVVKKATRRSIGTLTIAATVTSGVIIYRRLRRR